MVGGYQALLRDYLAGASAPKLHNRVFQGCVVDVVEVFRGQAAAYVAHVVLIEFLQHRQEPHTLVGYCGKRYSRSKNSYKKAFHTVLYLKSYKYNKKAGFEHFATHP
jgi:hypothetical protein